MKNQIETDLFSEFEPVSRQKWEEQIKKDLKGSDYKNLLSWDTLEGIKPLPFYRKEDLDDLPFSKDEMLSGRYRRDWRRCEPITGATPSEANRQIKNGIEAGADAVQIHCRVHYSDGLLGGNMTGTQLQAQKDFSRLLDGVDPAGLKLIFNSGMNTPAILAMLRNEKVDGASAAFLFDPFTYCATHGREPLHESRLNLLIEQLGSERNYKTLAADGLFYHLSGATIVQELGIALSIASEYLARSPENSINKISGSIFFRLSAGGLYFPEIAKYRAVKLLWANLLKAYGADSTIPLEIHAESTPQNKTLADPHNNILRATTEAMAAVLGGVDSLLLHPYDNTFRDPTSFSRRISRNVHHIIKEESYLAKVADPSAGSYYIESLTDQIARESWKFFQQIEKQGGFLKALKGRMIQSEINASKKRKMEAYATRERVLVGTNNYPGSVKDLPGAPISSEYTDALRTTGSKPTVEAGRLIPSLADALQNDYCVGDFYHTYLAPQKVLYTVLEPFRAGEIYENLRIKTESYAKKTGNRPTVQLIPAGNLKWRKRRATYAKNLLGCAGFEVDNPLGSESIESAVEAFSECKADIFVLCGSDKEYPEMAEMFCRTFTNRGLLILAGNPGDAEQNYRNLGIDLFIYSGIDIPETLQTIQERVFNKEPLS